MIGGARKPGRVPSFGATRLSQSPYRAFYSYSKLLLYILPVYLTGGGSDLRQPFFQERRFSNAEKAVSGLALCFVNGTAPAAFFLGAERIEHADDRRHFVCAGVGDTAPFGAASGRNRYTAIHPRACQS